MLCAAHRKMSGCAFTGERSVLRQLLPWLTIGIALAYVGLSGAVPLFTSLGDTLIQNLTPLAPPPATSDQIRVLTANLWHDFPRHRNLEARWDLLADAF